MNSKLSNRIRILFICILLVQVVTLTVFAAESLPTGLTGTDGTWNAENNTYSVTATGTSGCNSSAGTATMTLKNTSESDAVLSFTYTENTGEDDEPAYSVSSDVAGDLTLTSGKLYTHNMAAGETITFKVTTKAGGYISSIVLSDISFQTVQYIDIQLQPSENGSYTVTYTPKDSTEAVTETVTENKTVTVSNAVGATLAATPATDYKFVGWRDATTGKLLSTETTYVEKTARTVKPEFIASSIVAAFQVKDGGSHYYLNDALAEVGNSGTIIVVADATVSAGNYTIPTGVTLLIPYDGTNLFRGAPKEWSLKDSSAFNETPPASPDVSIISYADRASTVDTEYRRLTMASGANIIVNGALEVSGQTDSFGRGQRGAYSVIQMESNTSITVNGTLYAWGYVRGSGTVTVYGTVYEHFDVLDYPNAGAGGMSDLNDKSVFGMRDYSFNNVEVEATYSVGASLKAYICITGTKIGTNAFIRTFIGSTSDAVIQLTSGTIKKSYVNDRQKLEISGTVSLNSISISITYLVITYTMDSAATSGLPFARNWDVTCTSGGTITLNDSVLLYAGATITIDQGATVIVPAGKNIYIMDYASDPVNKDTTNIDNFLISVNRDAVLNINGELQVTSGDFTLGETTSKSGLYTTYSDENYASIISREGTGKITITGSVGTATTVPVRQGYYNNAAVTCNVTPAKLRNSDDSIVETANGGVNTYTYVDGYWRCGTHSFENGICSVCGINLFTIEAANVVLGNNLDMAFAFTYNGTGTLNADSGYYVKLERSVADGDPKTVTYNFDSWATNNGSYVVTYGDLAAKEMCDKIELAVYDSNGARVSDTWKDSIQDYAIRQIAKYEKQESSDEKERILTVLVDMLNYGAEAQNRFEYDINNLANAPLTAEQIEYATDAVTKTAQDSDLTLPWVASNLVTTSNIQFLMAFSDIQDGATVTVTFDDHYGEAHVLDITEFAVNNDVPYITIEELVVADAWQIMTIVLNNNGTEYTFTESIAGYLKRYTDHGALNEAFLKFAESAYNYFEYKKTQETA